MNAGQPEFAFRPEGLQQARDFGQGRRRAGKPEPHLLHALPKRFQRAAGAQNTSIQNGNVIGHPLHVGQLVR